MKRLLKLCLCACLVFSLGGCNFELLWNGITGTGYYSISRSDIAGTTLSTSTVPLSTLTTSSVIVYETRNLYYGKLALTAAATDSAVTIQFVTYNSSGSPLLSSNYTNIPLNTGINLETGASTTGTTADFIYSAGKILTPQNGSTFVVY
jgi:hypothetical protein